ncbi:MFS transporter [Mycolicibacter acidiphilus]
MVATGVSVINFWAWALVAPLAMTYREMMSLSGGQESLLVAAPLLTATLGRLIVGPLTDRFGGRIVTAAVCLVSTVPVLAVGAAANSGSYALLLTASLFLGIPGAAFAAGIPFVSEWYEPDHRGFATGVFGVGMAGTALSAYLTPLLAQALGVFATHLLVAVLLAVAAAVSFLAMRNGPYYAPTGSGLLTELKIAGRLRVTWEMSLLYGVVFGAFVAFSVYLPTYIDTVYRFSAIQAGDRTAVFALVAVLARPVGGVLADRIAAKYVVMAALIAMAVLAVAAAFKPPADLWAGAVFTALAAAIGIGTGAVFEWVAWRTPSHSLGAVTGIVSAVGEMGGFFPPMVMTETYDRVHNNYEVGLLLLAATVLIVCGYTAGWIRAHQSSADPEHAPAEAAAG